MTDDLTDQESLDPIDGHRDDGGLASFVRQTLEPAPDDPTPDSQHASPDVADGSGGIIGWVAVIVGAVVGLVANAASHAARPGWYWVWDFQDAGWVGPGIFLAVAVVPLIMFGAWIGFIKSSRNRDLVVPHILIGAIVGVTVWFYLGTEPAGTTLTERSDESMEILFVLVGIGALLFMGFLCAYLAGRGIRALIDLTGWDPSGAGNRLMQNWNRVRPSERTRFVIRVTILALIVATLWLQYRFDVVG